jgi:hypothetical protein
VLHSKKHLLGVVVTDGAVLTRPEAREETVKFDKGVVARRRRIDKWRVRESVVVPLHGLGLEAAHARGRLLDGESDWLARALEQAGLDTPSELMLDTAS